MTVADETARRPAEREVLGARRDDGGDELVSVVVPARNEAKGIAAALHAHHQ